MTLSGGDHGTTATRDDSVVNAKSFEIPKRLIWEAWKRVAANQGGPGVDRESIETFRNFLRRAVEKHVSEPWAPRFASVPDSLASV